MLFCMKTPYFSSVKAKKYGRLNVIWKKNSNFAVFSGMRGSRELLIFL